MTGPGSDHPRMDIAVRLTRPGLGRAKDPPVAQGYTNSGSCLARAARSGPTAKKDQHFGLRNQNVEQSPSGVRDIQCLHTVLPLNAIRELDKHLVLPVLVEPPLHRRRRSFCDRK
jgi:hypothetical protein